MEKLYTKPEDQMLITLCAIHNRLVEIAVTLQTMGQYLTNDESGKQRFRELAEGQTKTYLAVCDSEDVKI